MSDFEKEIIETIKRQFAEVNSMGTVEIVGIALKLFDSILDKMPDYEQRKKEDYWDTKKEYLEELHAENRDDNRLLWLRDQLMEMVSVFADELGMKK